ncbi:beta-N-acetylhexosaminidase [Streptomyces sp. NPDC004237]|uniref:beta-N-acetylhexosaminidase n=1 Tax=Streptomyces sp. NPDC004237 TaxID=3154455 RepID=UPI0033BE6F53
MNDNGFSRRRILAGALGTLAGVAAAQTAHAAPLTSSTAASTADSPVTDGGSSRPATIPALREWTARSGSFRIGPSSRILVRPTDSHRLRSDARLLAEDLRALTGHAGRIVVTNDAPQSGDVVLDLRARDTLLGTEGYLLTVGESVRISARASAGVFYGTRTLLQLLRQNTTVPAGTARDWPRYAERGLMIDIARKHHSYDWLAAHIKDLAYLKLNYLHIHFSDDEGWRIESRDGLQSPEYLTKAQVRSLIELAARHHITVVPEIDMPGHLGWALKSHPEFQLRDADGNAAPNKIDYSIPAARKFLRDLVEEYLPLFPAPYWHMGSDEFLGEAEFLKYPQLDAYAKDTLGPAATAKDGIHGLVNDFNKLVRSRGKTLRVWNDTFTPDSLFPVDKNVVVEWWTDLNTPIPSTNPVTPQELVTEGYTVLNASFYPTYAYPVPSSPSPATPRAMYENWAVHRFHGFAYFDDNGTGFPFHDLDPAEPGNRGAAVHFWSGGSTTWTEEQTAESLFPRLRVMAQKTWESAPLVSTYEEFEPIVQQLGSAPS